jgi:hypothetical protein
MMMDAYNLSTQGGTVGQSKVLGQQPGLQSEIMPKKKKKQVSIITKGNQ